MLHFGDIKPKSIAAAYLHDVLEDCGSGWESIIQEECGEEVLNLVKELTYPVDKPEWRLASRDEKNKIRYAHTENMSNEAKRIKMVDRWDNCQDMIGQSKSWVAKYVPESYKILEICRSVDEDMGKDLELIINNLENYLHAS